MDASEPPLLTGRSLLARGLRSALFPATDGDPGHRAWGGVTSLASERRSLSVLRVPRKPIEPATKLDGSGTAELGPVNAKSPDVAALGHDAESGEPLDKADVGLPTPVEPFIRVTETGLNGLPYGEGLNGILYTPGPTDPGFIAFPNGDTITYKFVSDGSVPEPATLVSMSIGITIVGLVCWRRRPHQRG